MSCSTAPLHLLHPQHARWLFPGAICATTRKLLHARQVAPPFIAARRLHRLPACRHSFQQYNALTARSAPLPCSFASSVRIAHACFIASSRPERVSAHFEDYPRCVQHMKQPLPIPCPVLNTSPPSPALIALRSRPFPLRRRECYVERQGSTQRVRWGPPPPLVTSTSRTSRM
ncbi:hypothetical protein K438DRAFT_1975757 [Mycena galopus ATCC 62051]|nr:hypothetical protein K438DRAFT_1975757 [Mycena galopus ATCC 62051]